MAKIRDRERTRGRIIEAGAREFSQKGYAGATLSGIARRAHVSKQLIQHHFGSKDRLFQQVHDEKFRPSVDIRETLPADPAELFATRFDRHTDDLEYIRFLTWEAASGSRRALPYQEARQQRISEYGEAIAGLQQDGRLPPALDPRLLHLAILALATYPMSFAQITKLVTQRSPTDPAFQKEWLGFLRQLGQVLLQPPPPAKKPARKRR